MADASPSQESDPDLQVILAAGARAHEAFVEQGIAMDKAFAENRFDAWFEDQIRQELEAFRDGDGRNDAAAGTAGQ